MSNKNYSIWIEAEEWAEGEWDFLNENTDVIVKFNDGARWVASFFTYRNITKLAEKNKKTGECLNGKYFWASDMILVDEVNRERIEEIIQHLIDENEFRFIFKQIEE